MQRLIATLGFTALIAAGCGASQESAHVNHDAHPTGHTAHESVDAASGSHPHDGGASDGDDDEVHGHGTHDPRDAALYFPDGATLATAATFTTIYNGILRYSCASAVCHGSGASAYLRMAHKDGAHAALLGQEALGEPCFGKGHVRVVPGAPDDSLLLKKLEGRAGCGERMPAGGAPLPPEQIQLIRAWIYAGAKND